MTKSKRTRRVLSANRRRKLLTYDELEVRRVLAAPILDSNANPTLGSLLEGATNPGGITVATMVVDGSITDPDGTAVETIAITRLNESLGSVQYSLDAGNSWLSINSNLINSQTNELSLLLGPSAKLRFFPFGDLNGTVSDALTFRAWDQSSGSPGQYVVIASTGGNTAFSLASDTTSITVTAQNDPPTFFSGDGLATTQAGGISGGRGAVLMPDGKVVLGGFVANLTPTYEVVGDFALARYHRDGSLDTSFGDGTGMVMTDFSGGFEQGTALAAQSDGKLLLAGRRDESSQVNHETAVLAIARYNVDGSLDANFGDAGRVLFNLGTEDEKITGIAVQPDGKILLCVISRVYEPYDSFVTLIRFNANGTSDTTFGTGGIVRSSNGQGWDEYYDLVLQPDGKILLGGATGVGDASYFALTRYNSNGTLDTAFGSAGKAITSFGGLLEDGGDSVALQPDGKILLSGSSLIERRDDQTFQDFATVRYNANGTLDTSFGNGTGKVRTDIDWLDGTSSVAIQSDGKILISGPCDYVWQAIVRYQPDGSPDPSFGLGGRVTTQIDIWGSGTLLLQPDGRILVGGEASSRSFALLRYRADGGLDSTFDLSNTLGGSVIYARSGNPVVLASGVLVSDVELSGGNFNGAKLTLARNGGANSQDLFSATGTLGPLTTGANLVVGGVTIGTVTANGGGTLRLTFNSNATNSRVNAALQQIAYSNSSTGQMTTVKIDWAFDDGNTGLQGTGGALIGTGSVTVVFKEAPVLDPGPNPTLGSVLESATDSSGVSVAAIVVDGSVSDPNGPAVEAIAITKINSSLGVAQYSLDGGATWLTINSALLNSQTNELALPLGPTAKIRLIPFGNLNGAISDFITFRAWDQSSETEGQYTIASSVGGSSSFSIAQDTASVFVTSVNDPPAFVRGDGTITTPVGSGADYGVGIVFQPDGKILQAGYSNNGQNDDFSLVRYTADGLLDTSFGNGTGKVLTDVGGGWETAYGVALQPDGKILLAGYRYVDETFTDSDFALVRYNSNGTLDTTFGEGDGAVLTSIGNGRDYGHAVTVQPDGKIVVVGSSYQSGTDDDVAVVRYLPDGSIDFSFGTWGKVTTDLELSQDSAWSVLVQPDGKLVIGGGTNGNFALLRYDASGMLDTGFGDGGKVITDLGGGGGSFAVTFLADGKLLLGGYSYDDFVLARYNPNGFLDFGFGSGGIAITDFNGGYDYAYGLAVQPDGKILQGGDSNGNFALARYLPNGLLDENFGIGGTSVIQSQEGGSYAFGIAAQPDGRILIGGYEGDDFSLARLQSDGSLDLSFDIVNTLGGIVSYVENGSPVVMDDDVQVTDVEIGSVNFSGATLTLARSGGANPQDLFSATGTLSPLTPAGNLTVGGVTIGTITTNSGGMLVLTFNSSATKVLVDSVLQQIAYANASDAPPETLQVDWKFSDGNNGLQGSGGPLSATGSVTVRITPINDSPVLSFLGGDVTYRENWTVFRLCNSARLKDVDNTVLNNGTLMATIESGAQVADRLWIKSSNYLSIEGNQLFFAGIVVGTWTGGMDGQPLLVSFNNRASVNRVQHVLRNISFVNDSDNPGATTRTVSLQVTDGSGGQVVAAKTVFVVPVNDAPAISSVPSASTYTLNGPVIRIAPAAIVTDPDAVNFAGGTLLFRITSGADLSNNLFVGGGFTVDAADKVFRNGVIVGQRNQNGGVGLNNLEITFNSNATREIVQELLKSISFRTVNGVSKSARTIEFSLTDGAGGTGFAQTRIDVT